MYHSESFYQWCSMYALVRISDLWDFVNSYALQSGLFLFNEHDFSLPTNTDRLDLSNVSFFLRRHHRTLISKMPSMPCLLSERHHCVTHLQSRLCLDSNFHPFQQWIIEVLEVISVIFEARLNILGDFFLSWRTAQIIMFRIS